MLQRVCLYLHAKIKKILKAIQNLRNADFSQFWPFSPYVTKRNVLVLPPPPFVTYWILRLPLPPPPNRDLTSVSRRGTYYTCLKTYLHTCKHREKITRKQTEIIKEKKRRVLRSATMYCQFRLLKGMLFKQVQCNTIKS